MPYGADPDRSNPDGAEPQRATLGIQAFWALKLLSLLDRLFGWHLWWRPVSLCVTPERLVEHLTLEDDMRGIREGRLGQGAGERIAYKLTTTPWGSAPGSVLCKLYDLTQAGTDVTATKLLGSATVSGDDITTPLVVGLVAAHLYRLDVQFVCAGNTFICPVEIQGER
jgi:hypothetical protein